MFSFPQVQEKFYEQFSDLIKLGFTFDLLDENEIEWTEFNEIHSVLNEAYAPRTKTFFSKAFGCRPPLKRVLCRYKGKLVGISAYFEDYILINDQKTLVGGVGMTCSIMPGYGIGNKLRYAVSCGVGASAGVPFCIGRVNAHERVKISLKNLVYCFLDIPLMGKTTKSHDWETIAIYKTSELSKDINSIQYLNNISAIHIDGEIF